jgi:hypothetical protein
MDKQQSICEKMMTYGYHIRHDDGETVVMYDGSRWIKVHKNGSVVNY